METRGTVLGAITLALVAGACGGASSGPDTSTPGELTVAVGGGFACVLDPGSGVFCWGDNSAGQLGVSPSTVGVRAEPTLVPGTQAALDLAVGGAHACAAMADDVLCWGANENGQIGTSNAAPNTCRLNVTDGGDPDWPCQPTPTSLGVTSRAISAGDDVTCVVDDQEAARCWGTSRLDLTGVGDLVDIEVGPSAACGLDADGALHCKGTPQWVGLPSFDGLPNARAVAVGGGDNGCIVSEAGEVLCWGNSNSSGQLGAGHTDIVNPWETTNPVHSAAEIAAGGSHFCALSIDGAVSCWGRNESGQVGLDPGESGGGAEMIEGQEPPQLTNCPGGPCQPSPILLSKLPVVTKLAASGASTCIVSEGDEVLCWGAIVGSASPQVVDGPWSL